MIRICPICGGDNSSKLGEIGDAYVYQTNYICNFCNTIYSTETMLHHISEKGNPVMQAESFA